jgi:hypothetical protein
MIECAYPATCQEIANSAEQAVMVALVATVVVIVAYVIHGLFVYGTS